MKGRVIAACLAASICLSACGNPLSGLKKEEKEQDSYELTPINAENLQENMFYVKNGDDFYPIHMGETNVNEENLIAKEANPDRIVSFTKDDSLIPTMYKDDTMIYYTKQSVPGFTWERFSDKGYTIGLYNLKVAESGKIQFVIGESKTDHGSASYAGLSQLELGDSVIIIDKIAGQSITADRLTECGSVSGLKPDEMANIDLYIGTQHHVIESMVDTHVLSSMELYQTNEYNLLPEGYASVKIPEYFLSGYYLLNGIGVVRYVANNRSEGIANVDLSVPYFYKDENGKQITLEEYNKLMGNKPGDVEKTADYEFSYDIDATIKSFGMILKYDLKDNEDPNDILYTAPSATITSPLGNSIDFEQKSENGKQILKVDVDGVVSGTWKIDIYDLKERKFTIDTSFGTGNADSFVHSGNTSGKITIHSDGVSGEGIATVKWENATHAAAIEIKSPSGILYNDVANADLLLEDGYGKKIMRLEGVEAGDWELKITGEELGRCWFTISRNENQELNSAENDSAAAIDETIQENETVSAEDADLNEETIAEENETNDAIGE